MDPRVPYSMGTPLHEVSFGGEEVIGKNSRNEVSHIQVRIPSTCFPWWIFLSNFEAVWVE